MWAKTWPFTRDGGSNERLHNWRNKDSNLRKYRAVGVRSKVGEGLGVKLRAGREIDIEHMRGRWRVFTAC